MKTSKKILQYINGQGEASAKELTLHLDISERAVFKQLAKLIETDKLTKIGRPPKVFYKIKATKAQVLDIKIIKPEIEKVIDQNFLYITSLGEYFAGIEGFVNWCKERKLNVNNQSQQYFQLISDINKARKVGVIIATAKFNKSFKNNNFKGVFYIDFYSIPQFGKTKLGQLLLYAKQSQDKKRIREISEVSKPYIKRLIKHYKIEAVGFIPPTIKREVQFMKELENNLDLNLSKIKLSKVKTEIIIPQKTLNKMSDRIMNAKNTIILEDKRSFNNVLLIDDAAGSGATLNETAGKIINSKVARNVFGLAITGSYKGFDVISEV